jgi:hypothetical protein
MDCLTNQRTALVEIVSPGLLGLFLCQFLAVATELGPWDGYLPALDADDFLPVGMFSEVVIAEPVSISGSDAEGMLAELHSIGPQLSDKGLPALFGFLGLPEPPVTELIGREAG